MKAKDIIIKSLKRARKERGLKITTPNDYLSGGHIKKADHNLIVMTDLSKLGHEDWVVVAAYYAMYQSASALLAKIGLESKDHATTVAVLSHFFGGRINKDLINKFHVIKKRRDKTELITMEDRYIDYMWKIKRARETVQYGISVSYKETEEVMKHAREFASKTKLIISELDKQVLEIISKRVSELKANSKTI